MGWDFLLPEPEFTAHLTLRRDLPIVYVAHEPLSLWPLHDEDKIFQERVTVNMHING